MFSSRSSFPREVNRFTRALEESSRAGRIRHDLTISNPTRVGLPVTTLDSWSEEESLTYTPASLGLAGARARIAAEFSVDPENVILTASTSEAYALLFKLFADPGDHILVPRPGYPLFSSLATFEGLEQREYGLFFDGEWNIDPQSLASQVGPRTRALLSVSPNNPTGSYLAERDFEMLMERGLPLIVDEVFYPYAVEVSEPPPPIWRHTQRGLVCSLGGLSKYAGLPQHKLSWILLAGDPENVAEARYRLSVIADTYLNTSSLIQHRAGPLLTKSLGFRRAVTTRLRSNLRTLRELLSNSPQLSCPKVEAGWYACLRVPAIHSSEDWAILLLQEGVVVHPGHFYDFDTEGFLVLSLLPREDIFADAARTLISLLDRTR